MPNRNTPWPAGTPCWIDYGASEIDAAKDFYGRLFGWEFEGGDPDYGGYLNATLNGEPAAGLGPLMNPGDSPGWTTYFATDDATATAARIREAGGTIVVEPMEVGPMGTMVIAADPQGNAFGLWQSGQHTGYRVFNEHGSLVWSEAAVDDPAAAREFYTAVFGFTWAEVPGARVSSPTDEEERCPLATPRGRPAPLAGSTTAPRRSTPRRTSTAACSAGSSRAVIPSTAATSPPRATASRLPVSVR